MHILPADPAHAPLIGRAIVMAIGDEITGRLAGPDHTAADVEALFTSLAARDDTQYSYRNSLVAIADDGNVAGVLVGYDGAGLLRMRRIFFSEAAKQIALDFGPDADTMSPETTPDEFYLDTLAVFPEYRGRGVARALINAAVARARECGKPLGLLVDKTNGRARALYYSVGFRPMDEREFAGELMDHMQLSEK